MRILIAPLSLKEATRGAVCSIIANYIILYYTFCIYWFTNKLKMLFFAANSNAQKESDAAVVGATLIPIGMLAISFALGCCIILGVARRR